MGNGREVETGRMPGIHTDSNANTSCKRRLAGAKQRAGECTEAKTCLHADRLNRSHRHTGSSSLWE